MELFPEKFCRPPLSSGQLTCTHHRSGTIISLAAFGDPVPHVEKEQLLNQRPVCLMEESLSITMETLEPLDPSSSPTLEIPRNTMKRRNPYLIKFPPLRLTRYLNSISLSVHEMQGNVSFFFHAQQFHYFLSLFLPLSLFLSFSLSLFLFSLSFNSGQSALFNLYVNFSISFIIFLLTQSSYDHIYCA